MQVELYKCADYDPQLLDHIKFGRNDEAKISANKKLAKRSYCSCTLLHWAVFYDNLDIAEHLIKLGSYVNLMDERGATPLMIAIQKERLASVELLLKASFSNYRQIARKMVFHPDFLNTGIIELIINKMQDEARNQYLDVDELVTRYGCAPHHTLMLKNRNVLKLMFKFIRSNWSYVDTHFRQFREPWPTYDVQQQTVVWVCFKVVHCDVDNKIDECTHLIFTSCKTLVHDTMTYLESKEQDVIDPLSIDCSVIDPLSIDSSVIALEKVKDLSFDGIWALVHNLIVHQVLLEKLGKAVMKISKCYEVIWRDGKIDKVEKCHEICNQILDTTMYGSVKLVDLLSDQRYKMMLFLRNVTFPQIIEEICLRNQLVQFFPYYYKILMIRIEKAKRIVQLEDSGVNDICRFFNSNIHECYYIARGIISYLDEQELERLNWACESE